MQLQRRATCARSSLTYPDLKNRALKPPLRCREGSTRQAAKLAWTDLRQQPNAPGVPYSFKYFQQVEGDFVLPAGFEPLRVSVRLTPQGGATVEQSFSWADALPPVPAAAS